MIVPQGYVRVAGVRAFVHALVDAAADCVAACSGWDALVEEHVPKALAETPAASAVGEELDMLWHELLRSMYLGECQCIGVAHDPGSCGQVIAENGWLDEGEGDIFCNACGPTWRRRPALIKEADGDEDSGWAACAISGPPFKCQTCGFDIVWSERKGTCGCAGRPWDAEEGTWFDPTKTAFDGDEY